MLHLILTIALLGFVLYLILNYIPMPPIFKTVIQVVVAVAVIVWVLGFFGLGV